VREGQKDKRKKREEGMQCKVMKRTIKKKMKVLTGLESWTYSFRLIERYKLH
jgi:hypothetical protein